MRGEIYQRLDIGTRLCLARTQKKYYDLWYARASTEGLEKDFGKLSPAAQCIVLVGERAHFRYVVKFVLRLIRYGEQTRIDSLLEKLAWGDHYDYSGRALRLDEENKKLVIFEENPRSGSTPYRILVQWLTKNWSRPVDVFGMVPHPTIAFFLLS
jgi:hypothetical protein